MVRIEIKSLKSFNLKTPINDPDPRKIILEDDFNLNNSIVHFSHFPEKGEESMFVVVCVCTERSSWVDNAIMISDGGRRMMVCFAH